MRQIGKQVGRARACRTALGDTALRARFSGACNCLGLLEGSPIGLLSPISSRLYTVVLVSIRVVDCPID